MKKSYHGDFTIYFVNFLNFTDQFLQEAAYFYVTYNYVFTNCKQLFVIVSIVSIVTELTVLFLAIAHQFLQEATRFNVIFTNCENLFVIVSIDTGHCFN